VIDLITFFAAIFVFGLLIASHEFGHFITAKASGIKVLEFAIGMGPKILGFKKGETNYSLRVFPIGGYVKMLGEDGESSDPRAFCNQKPWKRLIVITAGAFMNFLIAILLFSLVFINTGIAKPIISKIEPGYPAEKAGMMVNDKIIAVNNEKLRTWDEFLMFITENKEKPFNLKVQRDTQTLDFTIKPILNPKTSMYMIGVSSTLVQGSITESLKSGFTQTFVSIKQMVTFIGNAFQGKISSADVGGPVAIVKLSGQAAKVGFWTLLWFTAFLSINLGIINLIPFPALDGGWVIIILIEAITGRKIDENKIGIVNMIGFTVLIAFAIFITFKDILRLNTF
jgi:regulator of sigma E protease